MCKQIVLAIAKWGMCGTTARSQVRQRPRPRPPTTNPVADLDVDTDPHRPVQPDWLHVVACGCATATATTFATCKQAAATRQTTLLLPPLGWLNKRGLKSNFVHGLGRSARAWSDLCHEGARGGSCRAAVSFEVNII